jgi:hypothetical protein
LLSKSVSLLKFLLSSRTRNVIAKVPVLSVKGDDSLTLNLAVKCHNVCKRERSGPIGQAVVEFGYHSL